jgi:hypothetical protein
MVRGSRLHVMADFRRIGAVGRSLRTIILTGFEEEPPLDDPTNVALIRTDDLQPAEGQTVILPPAVSLLLYRCEVNSARNPGEGSHPGGLPQALNLHFLATAWGTDPEQEHHILGRTLQVLDDTPVLSGPRLDPSADWSSDDTVQLLLEDVTIDDLTEMFHSLGCPLRLSISIVARLKGEAEIAGGLCPDASWRGRDR